MSDYISRVKELNLPEGEFMVCGSAILDVLDIRKANDVDILVSPKLFEKLEKEEGWKRHHKYRTTLEHPQGISGAKQNLDFMEENYSLDEALPLATYVEGIPFMCLEMLVNAKTQLGREKDLVDIKMIQDYLEK
jgi:predicted nucleotidyltransferase